MIKSKIELQLSMVILLAQALLVSARLPGDVNPVLGHDELQGVLNIKAEGEQTTTNQVALPGVPPEPPAAPCSPAGES